MRESGISQFAKGGGGRQWCPARLEIALRDWVVVLQEDLDGTG
jgi:hypothetical protein